MSYFVNITAWTIHIKAISHISVIWYLILNSIVNLRDDRILEAVVSFYRIDSETAIERHRSRLPINDVNTVLALKKHLNSFLGLKELSSKYGLGDFDVELYHMATFQFICSLSDDLLSYVAIGEKAETILSSLQACFVIAHSSGDFIVKNIRTIVSPLYKFA